MSIWWPLLKSARFTIMKPTLIEGFKMWQTLQREGVTHLNWWRQTCSSTLEHWVLFAKRDNSRKSQDPKFSWKRYNLKLWYLAIRRSKMENGKERWISFWKMPLSTYLRSNVLKWNSNLFISLIDAVISSVRSKDTYVRRWISVELQDRPSTIGTSTSQHLNISHTLLDR